MYLSCWCSTARTLYTVFLQNTQKNKCLEKAEDLLKDLMQNRQCMSQKVSLQPTFLVPPHTQL